jgi:carboxynorspermidine decarboxylase
VSGALEPAVGAQALEHARAAGWLDAAGRVTALGFGPSEAALLRMTEVVDVAAGAAFVLDLGALRRNLALLDLVQRAGGAHVLVALKGFATRAAFPWIRSTLAGATCSGLWEAELAHAELGGEVHVYSPAYDPHQIARIAALADHVIVNSPEQWQRWRTALQAAPRAPGQAPLACGLRVNPEHSEVATALYDPCAPGSRLGTTREALDAALAADPHVLDGLAGLHLHTLCELGFDALERTWAAVQARFPELVARARFVNLGGGHHITKPGYDLAGLATFVAQLAAHTGAPVYLEPGEAVALEAGVLVARVLDVMRPSGGLPPNALLDVSATAHMPDTLEMPYRPRVHLLDEGALVAGGDPDGPGARVRLGGGTCLAGDVLGDWTFPRPLRPDDRLVFADMAHYTVVKTTTFNGVPHPALATYDPATDALEVNRRFDWRDYAARLG